MPISCRDAMCVPESAREILRSLRLSKFLSIESKLDYLLLCADSSGIQTEAGSNPEEQASLGKAYEKLGWSVFFSGFIVFIRPGKENIS